MYLLNIPKFNFFVFVFNATEVETAAWKIFCVKIPCRDFGLFRVVRPYSPWFLQDCYYIILFL